MKNFITSMFQFTIFIQVSKIMFFIFSPKIKSSRKETLCWVGGGGKTTFIFSETMGIRTLEVKELVEVVKIFSAIFEMSIDG
jgi:hypothetical protein